MAKPPYIELGHGRDAERLTILHEDRSVIAIDKPRGWMLVPFTWQKTNRNLQAAIQSSIGAGSFWARSRHVRFLRYIHRLDADTSGVLLFGKSPGAVQSLGELFESRQMKKRYLAVVNGVPPEAEWVCRLKLDQDPAQVGRMRSHPQRGKDAETAFRVLESRNGRTLIEALPVTGRTHQIRVHLASAGFPILGDDLYGGGTAVPLGLRAVELAYTDPFIRRPVRVRAPVDLFLREYGFTPVPTPTSDPAAASAAATKSVSAPEGPATSAPRREALPPSRGSTTPRFKGRRS